MQTSRDRTLIILLCSNAAVSAAGTSSFLLELFPRTVVAAVGLISAMLSSVTAAYIALTRDTEVSSERASR